METADGTDHAGIDSQHTIRKGKAPSEEGAVAYLCVPWLIIPVTTASPVTYASPKSKKSNVDMMLCATDFPAATS